jgi:hypothetical protein
MSISSRPSYTAHKYRITLSLATALVHTRHPNETIAFWIGQICINQNDSQEKSEQALLMGQIYSRAEQVLI